MFPSDSFATAPTRNSSGKKKKSAAAFCPNLNVNLILNKWIFLKKSLRHAVRFSFHLSLGGTYLGSKMWFILFRHCCCSFVLFCLFQSKSFWSTFRMHLVFGFTLAQKRTDRFALAADISVTIVAFARHCWLGRLRWPHNKSGESCLFIDTQLFLFFLFVLIWTSECLLGQQVLRTTASKVFHFDVRNWNVESKRSWSVFPDFLFVVIELKCCRARPKGRRLSAFGNGGKAKSGKTASRKS